MKIREKYNACKQRFKNLSLKKKLLLFYTALFLLPLLLISIIIYVEVSQSMTEKIQFSATQGYEQAKSYLEYKNPGDDTANGRGGDKQQPAETDRRQ